MLKSLEKQKIHVIACTNKKNVLGKNGELLYRMKKDFQWFQKITTGHTVIMGVKTYLEIGKALPNRLNVVIYDSSRPAPQVDKTVLLAGSLSEALKMVSEKNHRKTFIIGGASLYHEALSYNVVSIYRTVVDDDADGDVTFIPNEAITQAFKLKNQMPDTFEDINRVTGKNVSFQFEIWTKDGEHTETALEWLTRQRIDK